MLVNILYLFFKRNIHERYLSLNDPDDKQSNFARELKNGNKGKKQVISHYFNRTWNYAREKVLNNLEYRLFPIKNLDKIPTREAKPELAKEPSKHKKPKSKLQQKLFE